MISRLYMERQAGKNPLSPVRELPVLGILSAAALGLTMMAAKELGISDCLVFCCLDPAIAALLASVMFPNSRIRLHVRHLRSYALLLLLVFAFRMGEQGPGELQVQPLTYHHGLLAAARVLIVVRSILVKWSYASFGDTKAALQPPENALLFYSHERPKKHRFTRFPSAGALHPRRHLRLRAEGLRLPRHGATGDGGPSGAD